ncbi:Seizure protein 6 [Clarias magur]|uniref:Seizure protein 6 n=1 Tax=Clarias magur TaxID=1594786 RepID=A0A8J4TBC1_CLAMG|nr:Seizure protein 6 [Clarias magur]
MDREVRTKTLCVSFLQRSTVAMATHHPLYKAALTQEVYKTSSPYTLLMFSPCSPHVLLMFLTYVTL